jgi:CSLREA domain-containing protein
LLGHGRLGHGPLGHRRPLRLEPLEDRRMMAVITVTTNSDVIDFNDGVVSLREAVFVANTAPGADEIEFDFGHDGPETIVLTEGELAITDSLTITGAGAALLAIDASGSDLTPVENNGDGSRVFNISDGSNATLIDVTIAGCTITGGDVTGSGGAILNSEHTTLLEVLLESNASTSAGGAIRHEGGSLAIVRSGIMANHAASTGVGGGGGALSVSGGTGVEIVDSTLAENSSRTGGGIEIFGGSGGVSIRNSHVDRNSTVSGGSGGIWRNGNTALAIVDSTVDDNVAAGRGGGVEVLGNGPFLLEDSSVSGNRANGASFGIGGGGGIFINAGATQTTGEPIVIRRSRLADNYAVYEGGGVNVFASTRVEIENSEIVGNTTERNGGGVHVVSSSISSSLGMQNSIVAENHALAGLGGGVYGGSSVRLLVIQTIVRGNTSSGGGGGVAIVSGLSGTTLAATLLVRDSMVNGNSTAGDGGGIRLAGGTSALVNSTIADNSADGSGGGISNGSTAELMQVTISGNRAKQHGGGLRIGSGTKIARSTIANNQANSDGIGGGVGGGVFNDSDGSGVSIEQTIIGDNRQFEVENDLYNSLGTQATYSLIEKPAGSGGGYGTGNMFGVDPKLGPLADHGGPVFLDGSRMLTHALLAGSPAVDAGDPTGGTAPLSLAYRAEVLFDLPSVYFRFEETTGTTFTTDPGSGGGVGGTYSGTPTLGVAGAVPGSRAVGLDGVNDYLTVGPTLGTANTIEIWARSTTEQWNSSDWLARSNDATLFALNPIKNSKAWSAVVHGQVIGTFTPDAAVDIREWHQYALSWDITTGTAKMYFDGAEVAALTLASLPPFVSGTSVTLGRNNGSSSPQFGAGAIDEFAIYKRILSAEELLEHTRVARVANFDQRGETFARYVDGDGIGGARIDIGALEALLGETYTLVVDSLADENDGDYAAGDFTLREALAVANATPGAATIEFASSLTAGGPATIHLTQGELVIANSMVIHGPGAGQLTIDASGNDATPHSTLSDGVATNDGDGSRVLNIDDNTGALKHVEIVGLRLTGGDVSTAGGGVLVREDLTLRECVVEGNMAGTDGGGVFSGTSLPSPNSLTVVDSVVAGNAAGNEGGGIRKVIGDLTVDRTVIKDNRAGVVGGGISAANELVQVLIRDSVIKKNRATRSVSFGGGGVFFYDAVATILNSSVVQNQADLGGGIFAAGNLQGRALKILNSTVSNNSGGGITAQTSAEITLSTIINNAIQVNGLTMNSTIYAGTGASGGSGNFNIVNASTAGIVAPLVGVGEHLFLDGSRMPMHALLPNSPAIDAGNPAYVAGVNGIPEFDQRGAPFGRVVDANSVSGARIDVGSYERRPDEVLSFVVDTLEDDDGDDYSPGDRSLREVIALANAVTGVQTITFHPDLLAAGAGEILLMFDEIELTEALNIDGPGAGLLTVNAQQQSRVFNISATTGNFVIEGVTLAQGKTTGVSNLTGPTPHVGSGGAIRSMTAGQLTINDATIRDSGTTGANSRGGGVFAVGPVTLNRSLISGNSTVGEGALGGGLAAQLTATVIDSTVHGNRVLALDEAGGGVWASSNLTITRSTISANELAAGVVGGPLTSGIGGGGAFSQSGFILVTDSVVRDNVARGSNASGGGIRAMNGPVTITRSTISGNEAGGSGGGVHANRVDLYDSAVIRNSAAGFGGGIQASQQSLVSNSTVSGNSTSGLGARGGGIFGGTLSVERSTVTDNHTDGTEAQGGGVATSSSAVVRGSIVAGNTSGSGHGDDLWGSVNPFYSLLGNNDGATGSFVAEAPVGSPDARGNLIGGLVDGVIDPRLGPLANNGGPTLTQALLVGSPAINAGDPAAVAGVGTVPPFDQRGSGFVRVADDDNQGGARIDMGAYERGFGETYNFVVDTLADESDGDYSAGDFSLREAIELANANPGKDAIEFDPALWANGPQTIALSLVGNQSNDRSALFISDSLTIHGPGAKLLTLDASGLDPTPELNNGDGGRVIEISDVHNMDTMEVEISGLTIRGGDVGSDGSGYVDGGGIRVQRVQFALSDCIVVDNSSQASGGGVAIYVEQSQGSSIIDGCSFVGNYAGGAGGGLLTNTSNFAPTIVRDSLFLDNVAALYGGGVVASSNNYLNIPFILENSTISGNTALHGGGLYLQSADGAIVRNSTITNNTATTATGTGGVFAYSDEAIVENSIVAGNHASDGSASDLGRRVDGVFGNDGSFAISHSLIGTNLNSGYAEAPVGAGDASGNFIGGPTGGVIEPLLGPLANNGGPTKSHVLLPGSPAIDAGDPAAVAGMNGVPVHDQRGGPWSRVANGDDVPEARIDMGAVEWQLNPLAGDYNFNGVVDAADYTVWRDLLGSTTDLRADGTSAAAAGVPDGVVDELDYAFWKANFGNQFVFPQNAGSGSGAVNEGVAVAGELRLAGTSANAVLESSPVTVASSVDLGLPFATSPARRSSPAVVSRLRGIEAVRDDALLAWYAGLDASSAGSDDFCVDLRQEAGTELDAAGSELDEVFAALGCGL